MAAEGLRAGSSSAEIISNESMVIAGESTPDLPRLRRAE